MSEHDAKCQRDRPLIGEFEKVGVLQPCPCPNTLDQALHTSAAAARFKVFRSTLVGVGLGNFGPENAVALIFQREDGTKFCLTTMALLVEEGIRDLSQAEVSETVEKFDAHDAARAKEREREILDQATKDGTPS